MLHLLDKHWVHWAKMRWGTIGTGRKRSCPASSGTRAKMTEARRRASNTCSTVQRSAGQCSAVQCSAVQRNAVHYSAVQVLHPLQCSAVQCSEVQVLHLCRGGRHSQQEHRSDRRRQTWQECRCMCSSLRQFGTPSCFALSQVGLLIHLSH